MIQCFAVFCWAAVCCVVQCCAVQCSAVLCYVVPELSVSICVQQCLLQSWRQAGDTTGGLGLKYYITGCSLPSWSKLCPNIISQAAPCSQHCSKLCPNRGVSRVQVDSDPGIILEWAVSKHRCTQGTGGLGHQGVTTTGGASYLIYDTRLLGHPSIPMYVYPGT